ncbi:segregation and condensation protein A [Lysinibacillus alkalisoli]|uniref:Segregation and condensation protein A n=1 Tax=Lysinibacillus alkalisoli TaxID=1911548 RepID=A0A917G0T7_9BACI|nr:segregation/condensation protein A [Lysinibacillus alkalisoli]GGG17105.1 segregation and condensation protein A [Lysinibacillus alkalisoli]
MSYEVKIDAFSGPLDLLLHLIQRLEIDIYDIPVAEITAQYMNHIHAMQVLELDEASEYLVMAATLLAIKSRMLLPIHENELDEAFVEEVDPREELVQRLIEYKKYKEAANHLEQREVEQGYQYTRPLADLSMYMKDEQLALFDTDANVYDMLAAFQKMLARRKWQKPLSTRVARQEIAIKDRMTAVFVQLQQRGGKANFSDLFEDGSKPSLIATFLSILELMRQQVIIVQQQHNFDELWIILLREEWEDHDIDYSN